jgi:capsule biosynthesis phosphatase
MKRDWKIVCCDIDFTLCVPAEELPGVEKYVHAAPVPLVIERLQELRDQGCHIILHTARRMRKHKGDIPAIEAEVGEITRTWLQENKVPYDELVFGKPFADIYIDDKAFLPEDL